MTHSGNELPKSLQTIGNSAFYGCKLLPSCDLPNVQVIGNFAFEGCEALQYVKLPSSLKDLGYRAFYNCTNLTIWNYSSRNAYTNSNVHALYTNPNDMLLADGASNVHSIMKHYFNTGTGDGYGNYEGSYLYGFLYTVSEESSSDIPNSEIVSFTATPDGGESIALDTSLGTHLIKGLLSNTYYTLTLTTADGQTQTREISTKRGTIDVKLKTTGTYYLKYYLTATSDTTGTCTSLGVEYNGGYYEAQSGYVTITGLYPGKEYSVTAHAKYGNCESTYNLKSTTQSFSVKTTSSSSPTTLTIGVTLNTYGFNVTKITVRNVECVDGQVTLTGLEPGTRYYPYVDVYSGDECVYSYQYKYGYSTSSLVLTTESPKVVSAGNVIVSATSNITDDDEQVGFEWRRTDWTDDFASNTGSAVLYEGKLEGYIRNLNQNFLFKCRPYFLSHSGTYYYSDWIGVDPTNTSYFEPTVHTYDKITIEGNTALVKGYALTGTDGIKVQGFKYWKATSRRAKAMASSAPTDAKTVEASGQKMEVTLTGLDYDTEYEYQAFVTTNTGDTYYGDVKTFKTDIDPALPIKEIKADADNASTLVGIYDLNGMQISVPQKGINIYRYSDNSTRKVLVK